MNICKERRQNTVAPTDNSFDRKLTHLKAKGISDPDIDLFLSTFSNDAALVEKYKMNETISDKYTACNQPVAAGAAVPTFSKRHTQSSALRWYKKMKTDAMKLSDDLVRKLAKIYEPSAMIHDTFRGNDISFKTDADGNAIQVFVGKRSADGTIKGERYARTLKRDKSGTLIKDHWENKGKAS